MREIKVYSGYIKEKDKLLQSASGGVVTALSEKIIEAGGVVFGVRYTADFHSAEYCFAENIADLSHLKGSKYITSKKGNIHTVLSQKLCEGKTVLYVGLGCDIGAVRAYCDLNGINTEKLFTIDILCHGPAANGVHEKYVTALEEKYASRLTDFTIRYKKDGWTPFYIKANFENGTEHIEPFNESDFGRAFYRIAKPGCTKCKFKGENHKGDLCCGDFWGLTENMPGWNPAGVSIMIVQTPKGQELLKLLDDSFQMQEADEHLVLNGNPMYCESRQQQEDYEQFMRNMNEKGLHYAVSQFHQPKNGVIQRLRRFVKHRMGI